MSAAPKVWVIEANFEVAPDMGHRHVLESEHGRIELKAMPPRHIQVTVEDFRTTDRAVIDAGLKWIDQALGKIRQECKD